MSSALFLIRDTAATRSFAELEAEAHYDVFNSFFNESSYRPQRFEDLGSLESTF